MFNIHLEQLVDAVVTKVKSNGQCFLHRVTEARLRDDGSLQLLLAPCLTDSPINADQVSVTLSPQYWSLCHYLHVYQFTCTENRSFLPGEAATTTYIVSPRP